MQRATLMDKRIGHNIRRLRKKHGLTQADLSEALSVTFQMVQKYETGVCRVSAANIGHMADYLGEPPNEFYREEGDAAPTQN